MIIVSVRCNVFRVIKQGIVPCKLFIAASEITVCVGRNITDATTTAKYLHFRTNHSTLRYYFNREPRYLIQLCISGIVIRAFIAIIIP